MLQGKKKTIITSAVIILLITAAAILLGPKSNYQSAAEDLSVKPEVSLQEQSPVGERIDDGSTDTDLLSQTWEDASVAPEEDDPRMTQYAVVIDPALIGTWQSLLSAESLEKDYWIYTFAENGTYTYTGRKDAFLDEKVYESGTYTTIHHPDIPFYYASFILTCDEQTKTVKFRDTQPRGYYFNYDDILYDIQTNVANKMFSHTNTERNNKPTEPDIEESTEPNEKERLPTLSGAQNQDYYWDQSQNGLIRFRLNDPTQSLGGVGTLMVSGGCLLRANRYQL